MQDKQTEYKEIMDNLSKTLNAELCRLSEAVIEIEETPIGLTIYTVGEKNSKQSLYFHSLLDAIEQEKKNRSGAITAWKVLDIISGGASELEELDRTLPANKNALLTEEGNIYILQKDIRQTEEIRGGFNNG